MVDIASNLDTSLCQIPGAQDSSNCKVTNNIEKSIKTSSNITKTIKGGKPSSQHHEV